MVADTPDNASCNENKNTSKCNQPPIGAGRSRKIASYICRKIWDIVVGVSTLLLAIFAILAWLDVKEQLNITRYNAVQESRAYLAYNDAMVSIEPTQYTVAFKIKNFGKTPAYSVVYWIGSQIGEPNSLHFLNDVKISGSNSIETTDINPTATWPVKKTFPITQQEIDSIKNGDRSIFVYGIIKYTDSFVDEQNKFRCRYMVFLTRAEQPNAPTNTPDWPLSVLDVNNTGVNSVPCEVVGPDGIRRARTPTAAERH